MKKLIFLILFLSCEDSDKVSSIDKYHYINRIYKTYYVADIYSKKDKLYLAFYRYYESNFNTIGSIDLIDPNTNDIITSFFEDKKLIKLTRRFAYQNIQYISLLNKKLVDYILLLEDNYVLIEDDENIVRVSIKDIKRKIAKYSKRDI